MTHEKINSLLIVKLHALGDLVIISPALKRIRAAFPDAKIDLLTTNYTVPAAVNNPNLDKLIVVPNDLFFSPSSGTILPTLKLIRQLRSKHHNAAIIFHRHRAISSFVQVAGISKRFSFGGGETAFTIPLDELRHSVSTACDLADHAIYGLTGRKNPPANIEDLRLEWFPTAEESAFASDFLKEKGLNCGAFVIFYAGGGESPGHDGHHRRWKIENFVELARLIQRRHKLSVILMGGASDVELSEDIASRSGDSVSNWAGRFNIRQSAAITSFARLVVSNDSGPLHFSAAVSVPCVGLFGPTGSYRKMPPGERNIAVTAGLPCSPCYFGRFEGCLFDTTKCMESLTVESVFQAVNQIISDSGAGH